MKSVGRISKVNKALIKKRSQSIFHERDRSEDDGVYTKGMEKAARQCGVINLSNKGLASVPDRIYEFNALPEYNCSLESLAVKEEDAWWNQKLLTSLDLSFNSLTQLSPKIEQLGSLTTLILNDNALKSLPKEMGKLEKLTRLSLSRNCLQDLPVELFTLPELRFLNLSYNQFEQLHADISDLHMLETLDLSHNKLTTLPGGIGFLVRLKELLLSYNKLKELPADIVDMRSLQKLDVMHNDLVELPADLGSLRKLTFLYAQHNDIKDLPDFEGCIELRELYLANNFIEKLPDELFGNLSHLEIFDLRDNKISIIPADVSLLVGLKRLDLSNNSLSNLPSSLALLPHLISLQIEGNPIRAIRRDVIQSGTVRLLKFLRERIQADKEALQNDMAGDGLNSPRKKPVGEEGYDMSIFPDKYSLRKSRCLSVTMKNLTEVPEKLFQTACQENIGYVDFSKNRLGTLPEGLQHMSKCATELIFANNAISKMPSFISQFTRVSLINISVNFLSELPEEFGLLDTLRELNISNNRFENLPQCIYNLKSLEVLLARENRIANIDPSENGLGALKRLAKLDLRNNNIGFVPPALGNLTNLTNLDLVGNPFRQPRHQILEKGTNAILSYLRDRIPV